MDDPKCGQTIGRIRYGHRYQGLGVICIDCGARETKPGVAQLVATTPHTILGVHVAKTSVLCDPENPGVGIERYIDHVLVATSDGIFERDDGGVFRECVFERIGD